MDYKDILYNYAEYFEQSDVASTVIRWIGWEIIKLLHSICDLCQGLWEAVFQALDFTQVFAMKVGEFYPIWYSLFVVTILAAGTIFLFSEHRPPLLKNLIITMAVVMLLPGGVRLGAQLLQIEQTAFMADGNSVADTTVISNVTDLLYQKNNDWSFESPNCFSGATIKYIDPNEQVEKKTAKVFKYYMVVDEASGEVTYKKIGKGFFGLLTPLYYRYSIHFMAIIGELIVNSLVLIFASYRLFRLIWDMIYGEILAYILSGDVVSGEKTKQVLQYLLNLFWSISIMIWGFAIWREFEIWVASQYSNNFIRILLIAFGGVAMIDGPDIVERVCGIDVGMKDGMMKTMGAMHLMQSGLGAAKKGGELAKTAAGAAKKAGSSMLNPGGKAQKNRMQAATGNGANAQQPPGGVGNPGGSAATAGRKEPPGGAQQPEQSRQAQGSGATSQASGDSSTQTNAQESKPSNAANTSGVDAANTDGFANNSASNSGGATTSEGQTGNTETPANSASGGSAAMPGSILSGQTGMQAQAQKNGQSSSAGAGKKPEQKSDSSGRTGKEPPGQADTRSDSAGTASKKGTQTKSEAGNISQADMQNQKQKTGEASKTKQTGTEPPGGASKTQANGQTDRTTAGQDSSNSFARENDEPIIQSESMAGVSSENAEPEGGVSSANGLVESSNSEPTEVGSSTMHEMGNDSESGSGVEASSIAVDAKQQETEPMKNTSGRVLIGHTSDTSDSNISSRDDNILKKEESSRMRKSTQAEANLSNRTDSDSGKIQHKNLAGSRVKTKNGSVSHANQSAKKATLKPSSSERVQFGHGIEPPTRTEKPDNN